MKILILSNVNSLKKILPDFAERLHKGLHHWNERVGSGSQNTSMSSRRPSCKVIIQCIQMDKNLYKILSTQLKIDPKSTPSK